MCTKTEQKILIISKPFIKKTNARVVVGCSHQNFAIVWKRIVSKYEKENGPVPGFGLPTSYFLNEMNINREDLVKLDEYEKRFNA